MRVFGLPELKIFLRSGSINFALDRKGDGQIRSVNVSGHPFYYRAGSSDTWIILEVLMTRPEESEYWLPDPIERPRVILDIGGNIGCTAVYFARQYPEAMIHSFEPDPHNFELLRMNTTPYQNIKIYNVGLGDSDQELPLGSTEDSINHGAKTLLIERHRAESSKCVSVRNAYVFLTELGITNPDIIKIDTEGYEYPILKSLKPTVSQAQWVFGELHDSQDFSTLALLDSSHSIGIVRGLGQRFSPFFACRRDLLSGLSNANRKRLLERFSPK